MLVANFAKSYAAIDSTNSTGWREKLNKKPITLRSYSALHIICVLVMGAVHVQFSFGSRLVVTLYLEWITRYKLLADTLLGFSFLVEERVGTFSIYFPALLLQVLLCQLIIYTVYLLSTVNELWLVLDTSERSFGLSDGSFKREKKRRNTISPTFLGDHVILSRTC